ncbi:biotin/lipoyl-binding protein [Chenggangzhangella methanolivorans]|uniref:Biotin/lipoyl-binding protein n=1 Tax=Chenggangzhangella methanolivorans TaxID=1437009 RepID=A0A9E6UGR8_9HYPH|nr:biotin/lipoyl-binding protein [Chenggangzhangella methanolivorans]QZN99027.1 biotin/lipoyl-binding protein [Chenggangzhangella methanolivorans]
MARLGIALVSVAIAAAAGVGVWHFQRDAGGAAPAPRPKPAIPVTAVEARRADVPLVLSGLGVIQPLNVVTVRSRVDGEVVELAYEEGREVKEGDLLVQIDPRPYKAALDQAKAKQAQDEAQFSNAERDLARSQAARPVELRLAPAGRQPGGRGRAAESFDRGRQGRGRGGADRARLHHDPGADERPRGLSPRRQGQSGALVGRHRHRHPVADRPDHRRLHPARARLSRRLRGAAARPRRGRRELADGRQLGRGELSVLNSQIDQTTGTFKAKATFANADGALWPGNL